MKNKIDHTKTPWMVTPHWKTGDMTTITGANNYTVAECNDAFNTPQNEANARFIVEACNNYNKLVSALKGCIGALEGIQKNEGLSPEEDWKLYNSKQIIRDIENTK